MIQTKQSHLEDAIDKKIYFNSMNNTDFVLCGKLRHPADHILKPPSNKSFLIENDCFYIYFGYDDVIDCNKIGGELYVSLSNLPF